MSMYTSIYEFLKAHDGEVFHYWVYRRIFTPYEQNECFMDESIFEDTHASTGIIKECAPLGNGDFLLGFQPVDDLDDYGHADTYNIIEYYKLSEIRLARHTKDIVEE